MRDHRQGPGRTISIHAPREGSDILEILKLAGISISIHAPREGSDGLVPTPQETQEAFLSTLPARGATRRCACPAAVLCAISIHAPREGSDRPDD